MHSHLGHANSKLLLGAALTPKKADLTGSIPVEGNRAQAEPYLLSDDVGKLATPLFPPTAPLRLHTSFYSPQLSFLSQAYSQQPPDRAPRVRLVSSVAGVRGPHSRGVKTMPPKRKAAPKKKKSPSPSESEVESEVESEFQSEEDLGSESEPESPKPKKSRAPPAKTKAPPKTRAAASPKGKVAKAAPAKKEPAAKKEARKTAPKGEDGEKQALPAAAPEKKVATKRGSAHLIIEHCKQCQSFKQRAVKIHDLVKKSVPDVEIDINPEKPRKGCFEIREAGPDGKVFLSLQGLVRPFPKLKALNIEETAQDVIAQIT
ncbi:hypothetical protein R1flu_014940 [Riccia fluitans]|uniref:Selenoprotein H n=1 Tax=Riccia fluitans TaxID=41844 RepID=A0ABD1YIM5_9MARC